MTIVCNMIVKNESDVIKRAMLSADPFVDCFCIVDTGSTDGTQDIVRNYPRATLYERPWKDFGTNRQEALELARHMADHVLFLDADDILTAPADFQWPELTLPGYTLPISYADTRYTRCALVRADAPWRWEGVVHEFLTSDVPLEQGVLNSPTIVVLHDGARSKDPETYAKDAALLEDAERTPRNVFYLAQSYRDAGQDWKALFAYEERSKMQGWEEETWYASYEAARLMERLDVEACKFTHAYQQCYQRRPTRAEPLYQLARYHRSKTEWSLAYLFAAAAVSIPRPADRLFVDGSIYDWRALDELGMSAYYVGKFDEGKAANWRLLTEGLLPEGERERVQKNYEFYK